LFGAIVLFYNHIRLMDGRTSNMQQDDAGTEGPDRRKRVALVATALFCFVGLGISVELMNVYVLSHTDPNFQSFCAVSEEMNCETVALSTYSTVLGVPVAVWAIAGYLFVAVLALVVAIRRRPGFGAGLLFVMAVLFCIVSLALIFVMSLLIGSFCILCLALDAINASLFVMTWIALKGQGRSIRRAIADDASTLLHQPLTAVITGLFGLAVLGAAWAYGSKLVPASVNETAATTMSQPSCESGAPGSQSTVQMGMTESGRPWVGAAQPTIEVQEFTDYQCPHCRRAHMMVRKLLSDDPSRIRVYHRHLPLDSACNPSIQKPFHDRACELSRIAVCAGRQGRFWEMNDFLFQHADEIRTKAMSANDIASRLELNPDVFDCCMRDESATAIIAADVTEANRLGIKGTPAFLINGAVHYGRIPEEALHPPVP